MKVSRGVARIGLGQHTLSLVKVLGRLMSLYFIMIFVDYTKLLSKVGVFPTPHLWNMELARKGDLPLYAN